MDQGAWCDEELTMAWERYMQTEGLTAGAAAWPA